MLAEFGQNGSNSVTTGAAFPLVRNIVIEVDRDGIEKVVKVADRHVACAAGGGG